MSFWQRIRSFMRFALGSARRARELGGDVVFATSTPLTIAIPGIYASRRNRLPMVFELRDMWPDVPIAMGAVRNPLLIAAARWFEQTAYRRSAAIVALAPGMKPDVVARGTDASKVIVIPNGCDNDVFAPAMPGERGPRQEFPWLADRPLVLYPGSVGRVNGVQYMVHAAAHALKTASEARFVIIGSGGEWDRIRAMASELGVLDVNLFMVPALPKRQLAAWVRACNFLLCLIGPKSVSKDAVQNKFFDAMAAGKPTASNFEGYQSVIARDERIGLILDPDDPARGADELLRHLSDTGWMNHARERSLELANGAFNRDELAGRLLATLEAALRPGERRLPT
jgi:glycosyltransferase involved in cell wall biosynthesis